MLHNVAKYIADIMQFSGKYPADIHKFIANGAVSFYFTSEENA